MPTKFVTLTNSFHGTKARVRVHGSQPLERAVVRRVRKALCGIFRCTCGDSLGCRGLQTVSPADDTIVLLMPMPDGRVFLEIEPANYRVVLLQQEN